MLRRGLVLDLSVAFGKWYRVGGGIICDDAKLESLGAVPELQLGVVQEEPWLTTSRAGFGTSFGYLFW